MGKSEGKRATTRKVGRPSLYSQSMADEICELVAQGYSLRKIKETIPDSPEIKTIFNWFRTQPEFLQQYTRAKEESADLLVEQMLDLADDADDMNPGSVHKARLQVDTRKWIAMKLKPKKYGDKMDVTSDGKELPAPIINILAPQNVTDGIEKTYIEADIIHDEETKVSQIPGPVPSPTPDDTSHDTQTSRNIMDELDNDV